MKGLIIARCVCALAMFCGCGQERDHSQRIGGERISVASRSSTQWTIDYTVGQNKALSLELGERNDGVMLFLSPGKGKVTLDLNSEGLTIIAGGQKAGPVSIKDFRFLSEKTQKNTDVSIAIGKDASGNDVSISIRDWPNK